MEIKSCSGGECRVVNGTHYSVKTPLELVSKLEELRITGERVRFIYGDKDGPWGDIETGRIGRSTGTCKIPLVIHNRRSSGGSGLFDYCVIRIEASKGKCVIWEAK